MRNKLQYIKNYIDKKYNCIELYNEDLLETLMQTHSIEIDYIKLVLECADKFLLYGCNSAEKKIAKLGAEWLPLDFSENKEKMLHLVIRIDYGYLKNYFYLKNFVTPGDAHKFERKIDKSRDLFYTCLMRFDTFMYPFVKVIFS